MRVSASDIARMLRARPQADACARARRRHARRAVGRAAASRAVASRDAVAVAQRRPAPRRASGQRTSRCTTRRSRMISVPTASAAEELRPLQRLGLLRQRREPAVDAALPVVAASVHRPARGAAGRAERQGEQPPRPQRRRQRRQQAEGQRRGAGAGDDRQRDVVELPACRRSSGSSGASSGMKVTAMAVKIAGLPRLGDAGRRSAPGSRPSAEAEAGEGRQPRQHREGDDRGENRWQRPYRP